MLNPQSNTSLVELQNVRFGYGERVILDNLSLTLPKGKVTVLMGASGGGKTTVLRLIGGQVKPQEGTVLFQEQNIPQLAQKELYDARRRMGMLFQFGALFTDLNVFDNVAFPLREHSHLSESMIRDIVLMKLNAVGLRGAQHLMPSELSGGMSRRVALARAIALDPELVMYDEPFSGLDPISMGTAAKLIRHLNDSMGLTSLVVSHELEQSFALADQIIILANGKIAAQGTPQEVMQSKDPLVMQYINAQADGPVGFHYPGPSVEEDFGLKVPDSKADQRFSINPSRQLSKIGTKVRSQLAKIGFAARLFFQLCLLFPTALKRPGLIRDQIHFLGNYSLAIIGISGLFVGFVFGLQGYYTLQRYGSAEALGLLVTLSLVRELGPVVTALLYSGRAGTSLTAEIGIMKAQEITGAMEMMAVDPIVRTLAPRFWAGVITMPLLAAFFSAMGIIGGWVVGVLMIGVDAGSFWSQIQGGVDVWKDVGNGVVKSIVFGFTCTFIALYQAYVAGPTPEGVSQATTRTVVMSSLAVLGLDFMLTAMMFSI